MDATRCSAGLRNTRECSQNKALANAEVAAIWVSSGVVPGQAYLFGPWSVTGDSGIRYSRVVIRADGDSDVTHKTGALINMFSTLWPSHVHVARGYLTFLVTPTKATERFDHSQPFVSLLPPESVDGQRHRVWAVSQFQTSGNTSRNSSHIFTYYTPPPHTPHVS
jgi:hypothetical protein